MQIVSTETARKSVLEQLVGVPLSVVFADAEAIAEARKRGKGELVLEPPLHVSDADAYLVLPSDIGVEIVDIMRDADFELLNEALRDGLLCVGAVSEPMPREPITLDIEWCAVPAEALRKGMPYATELAISPGNDPLEAVRAVPHLKCTVASELLDDEGLDRVLRKAEYLGVSWQPPKDRRGTVDPTYVLSKRLGPGRVGIELALFLEYEEIVVLVRPLVLAAS